MKMFSAYIPIFGELKQTGIKSFQAKLNIVSFTDSILLVDTHKLILKKHHTSSCVLSLSQSKSISFKLQLSEPLMYETEVVQINIPDSLLEKVYVFNCDCHFVPETGAWDTVDTSKNRLAFHVGDQIYFDKVFIELCDRIALSRTWYGKLIYNEPTHDEIRATIYETAKNALLRKRDVLLHCFNIMLGDDHDICDETFRIKYDPSISKHVIDILFDVYKEIQSGLRLSDEMCVIYENVKVILVDNIRAIDDQAYINVLRQSINIETNANERLWIMSPRVPMNNKIDTLTSIVYGKESNLYSYKEFYQQLLSMNVKEIRIFCGDEHIARTYSIGSKKDFCTLYFVGAMNSVLDFYESNDYINGVTTRRLSNYKKHSYITIENTIPEHILIDSCSNEWCGPLYYFCAVKC